MNLLLMIFYYFLYLIFSFLLFIYEIYFFSDILKQSSLNINYLSHLSSTPFLWLNIRIIFIIFSFISILILNNSIFNYLKLKEFIFKINSLKINKKNNDASFNIIIGKSDKINTPVFIPEKGLYQNILITGAIGSGKTSSAMYPITKQLISFNYCNNKMGMLILDVKGNYHSEVLKYAKLFNRENDFITIQIGGKFKYNPLDKPNLKPLVLANHLKTILLLFSPNNSESYWLDKCETILAEAIKLCRLYNNNYVTFIELHKIITDKNYYNSKVLILKNKFISHKLNKKQISDLLSALKFFENEFYSLDDRTINILKSEITRITNCFVSDNDISKTFCPSRSEINFKGFHDVINSGKIVVLNMNINEYKNLSRIIAAYLKLDFQTEVLSRLSSSSSNIRPVAFISDEYSEYVSATDANFFSQSREAKCINVVSTQSYTSLLNTLNNKYSVSVIVQNLVNKLWFRSDDMYTIEDAQKQIGKTDKTKISKTISENAKETSYNLITHSLNSSGSNISESFNTYSQTDYIYDTNFFTQNLKTFECLAFLSDGEKIIPPQKIKTQPYFK